MPHSRGGRRRAAERQGTIAGAHRSGCGLPRRRSRASSAASIKFRSKPESIDLAVSLLSLHEADDIPGALIQIRRALRPDGLFLGAMAGGGTLAELRESLLAAETELHGGASPRVAPFTDVRDAGALLQRAGFALAGHRCRDGDRTLRFAVRPDAGPARHGRVQRTCRPLAASGDRGGCSCVPPRSTPSALPIRTAASGRPLPSSGCRDGHRTPRSSSR